MMVVVFKRSDSNDFVSHEIHYVEKTYAYVPAASFHNLSQ